MKPWMWIAVGVLIVVLASGAYVLTRPEPNPFKWDCESVGGTWQVGPSGQESCIGGRQIP